MAVLTFPTKWGCPRCLILDEQDTVMIYDVAVGRKIPHTRCRHCGLTLKKPNSVGAYGSNGRFSRGPHKPQIRCPRCGRLGSVGAWRGEKGSFIYHCGVSKNERLHYVPVNLRGLVLGQLKAMELQQ